MKKSTLILATLLAGGVAFGQQPHKPRIIDKKFLGLATAELAGNVLDIYTRQRTQEINPASWETNPLLGPHPSAARMTATLVGFSLATDYLAYRLRKSKRFNRGWLAPFAWSFAGSAAGIRSNMKWDFAPATPGTVFHPKPRM